MDLMQFTAVETSQVWVLHRKSGESVFIEPEGKARVGYSPAELRCPFDGCEGPIALVGPAKRRHHFRHLGAYDHVTAGESIFHLEAKTMMAQWLRSQVPDSASVDLERVVAGTNRRADVLVTFADASMLAVEIEYKSFDIAAAEEKHREYAEAGVACLWMIGHSRVGALDAHQVALPGFAARLRALEARVLAINPTLRRVASLAQQQEPDLIWDGKDRYCHAHVYDLDVCTADSRWLLRTPFETHLEVLEAKRLEEERAREERTRLLLERNRLAAERARELADLAAEAQRRSRKQHVEHARSKLKGSPSKWALADCLHIPAVHTPSEGESVFKADPWEWKAALFASCIAERELWEDFDWRSIRSAFVRHRISTPTSWNNEHFEAVKAYLSVLERDGWIFIVSSREFAATGKPMPPTPGTGPGFEDSPLF